MKTSLQTRLIILMAIASAFLISAFTIIQVNNQLQKTREFNIFKAKEGSFILMEKLRTIFASADTETPSSHILIEVKKIFSSLKEAGIFETAALLDRSNKPVVLEGDLKLFFEDEEGFLDKLTKGRNESEWLVPFIDKEHRIGNLFIIIENPYGYVAKVSFSLANFERALRETYGPVFLTVIIVLMGNVVLATLLSRALISPVRIFNKAVKDIAGGDFQKKVNISTHDELEELADTFNNMSEELIKMRARAESANPLTKLPGNIVISEEVTKRIENNKKFLLIYADLDNFKAFNDKYGIELGDRAIILTANIFKEAIANEDRSHEDFLGHEGGDDFLLLTAPERADRISEYIIAEFDKRIRTLYAEEDLKRGYIESRARDSKEVKKFSVMTISLAGVGNFNREITSYAQLTNIVAELKHKVKESAGSTFIIDRRGS
jgi:diguanylate cyclase (GGDEF)-like protein